jgi:secreted trypsin-like serine protease
VLACLLIPAVGVADRGSASSVVGGDSARAGQWPEVAAILYPALTGDEARCTGTLIAPNLVVTAAHCYDAAMPPDRVLIGATSLARPGDGETIAIQRGLVYPDAATSLDVAVLVLERASSRPPRPIALGWPGLEVARGAPITLVGFGAVDPGGTRFVNELQAATTIITDADCTRSVGCNPAARPAGELGAGGMGVDTCPGDSGGPLYVHTAGGAWLAGVTSRAYDDLGPVCSDGGIYTRADKVVGWIEATTGVTLSKPGAPAAGSIAAVRGAGAETRIQVNDPDSADHRFELTTPPKYGTANVRGDGALRVCIDPAAPRGADQLTVTIVDAKRAGRALPITVAIEIQDGEPATAPCDVAAFDAAGCCDSRGHPGGALALTLGVVLVIGRRRVAPGRRTTPG